MSGLDSQSGGWRLISIAGPTAVSLAMHPPGPVTIGRRTEHDLELSDRLVSRDHARLAFRPVGTDAKSSSGEWILTDLNSKHGTWINGRRLSPGEPMPLRAGDLIAISPWTFRLEDSAQPPRSTMTVLAVDEPRAADATIVAVQPRGLGVVAQQRLALLLHCAEALHGVGDESGLAKVVLDAAVAGTGFANAAIMHPVEEGGQVMIVEHRGAIFGSGPGPKISRSLVRQAGGGEPARLSRRTELGDVAQSIVELAIEEALCVPIVLESAVVLLLYLDDRGSGGRGMQRTADAAEFAIGLARLAGLALANLRRLDIERRQARVEAELKAAAEAQRWVMPRRSVEAGRFRCAGESRPGQYVGGDFFDVIPLDGGRLAVAVGDVSGKGVAASVLMTVAQGYLNAALRRCGDPGQAVTELNEYLCPRCQAGKFLSLWVGVFDGAAGTLTCVDAGHGYALLGRKGGPARRLESNCGLLGILPGAVYEAAVVRLPDSGRVLVVSDGIIEQPGSEPEAGGAPEGEGTAVQEQFGIAGVQRCLTEAAGEEDVIAALFAAVQRHGGATGLADDATAVVVEW